MVTMGLGAAEYDFRISASVPTRSCCIAKVVAAWRKRCVAIGLRLRRKYCRLTFLALTRGRAQGLLS